MIRIAIQSKGRLSQDSQSYLKKCGLEFDIAGRKLLNQCTNQDVMLMCLRTADIPEYVKQGVADFGIVGQNTLIEKAQDCTVVKPLGFGHCCLKIAVPTLSPIKQLADLGGERIATAYPNILKNYLKQHAIRAAIIMLSGSLEIAPALHLADAICDLVQSGATLKANGLRAVWHVMDSQAVLIKSPNINTTPGFLL